MSLRGTAGRVAPFSSGRIETKATTLATGASAGAGEQSPVDLTIASGGLDMVDEHRLLDHPRNDM
ncbi:MAG: hypothetical protein M1282_07190 [Chloroflexi bacterium]|nr:hypothetical protein [Chloroflexota bacterium]